MFIAAITIVAILSVCALYAWETYNVRLHRRANPSRTGADPEFARMRETDWWDQVVTSAEFARK